MKELKFITLAQIVGCILVVFGHSYPFVTQMPQGVIDVRTFIYTFHMPLFVFCSGYLLAFTKQTERKSHGEFMKQRAKRLLLPYFVLSLVGVIPKYVFSSVLNETLGFDTMSLVRAFLVPRENIWGHFWFLPMIFFLGWIGFVVEKYVFAHLEKKWGWSIVFVLMLILAWNYQPIESLAWFGINDIIKYGWSYALGLTAYYWIGERLLATLKNGLPIGLTGGGVFILSCVLWKLAVLPVLVIGIAMIFAIILLCKVWEPHTGISRRSLIAQTYQIFILSWPCQLVVEIITERLLHLQWWVIIPSVFCVGVVGPLLILKLIEWFEARTKTRFLSIIIGK